MHGDGDEAVPRVRVSGMIGHMATNLADPDREPTDEELQQLSREAFAGVRDARERALAALRARIEVASARVLAELGPTPPRPAR